ncbi:MAG: hypothetical protein M1839_008809 [Geoglossum umbratile]|nr:MAG: hypothetical protein M1839_008809 [Geoglossum umbratile]
MSSEDTEPLLREGQREAAEDARRQGTQEVPSPSNESHIQRVRLAVQRILASKIMHYSVLLMVTLDVSCIFGDIFIDLFTCGQKHPDRAWGVAREALGNTSLVFSILFMLELLASVWAFGFPYFRSWFHCFDAAVISVGFVVDVLLHGVVEEVASLVVILRLWRIFKIVEEFSVGAEAQMDALTERVEQLEDENRELKKELNTLRGRDMEGLE